MRAPGHFVADHSKYSVGVFFARRQHKRSLIIYVALEGTKNFSGSTVSGVSDITMWSIVLRYNRNQQI